MSVDDDAASNVVLSEASDTMPPVAEPVEASHILRTRVSIPRALVLTSGGLACPLNTIIWYARRACLDAGLKKVFGVLRGYAGLLAQDPDLIRDISDYPFDPRHGGTFLRCMRGSPAAETSKGIWQIRPDEAQKIVGQLDNYGVQHLIAIGGNGTGSATALLHEHLIHIGRQDIRVHFLPRTIDNDIGSSDPRVPWFVAPGYPSAVRKIAHETIDLRVESTSTEGVYLVQTQGRDAGWTAAATALGRADILLVPETDVRRIWGELLERIREHHRESNSVIIGVSEGVQWDGVRMGFTVRDGKQTLGAAQDLRLKLELEDGLAKLRFRVHHTDYRPRMGPPTGYDYRLAMLTGQAVGSFIERGQCGLVPVLREPAHYSELTADKLEMIPLASVRQQLLRPEFYDENTLTITPRYLDVLRKITSGPPGPE